MEKATLRLAGVIKESIVDGPGIRYTVFVQGCPHHCPGCHNPETHPFEGGREEEIDTLIDQIKTNPLLRGVTLSGGEPFCQAGALAVLAEKAHALGKNVMTYSGYTFEQLVKMAEEDADVAALLAQTDILVDGPFVQAQKSLMLRFRGSANQRLLDVKKSLEAGTAVEAEL